MRTASPIIKDHEIAKSFKFFRKQALQLPSKTRYIAAQFERYFKDDLYLDIARSSTSMATKLSEALSGIKQLEILYPVQSNAVFAKFPREHLKAIREKYFFYVWDEVDFSVRIMTSFDSNESDISEFSKHVRQQLEDT